MPNTSRLTRAIFLLISALSLTLLTGCATPSEPSKTARVPGPTRDPDDFHVTVSADNVVHLAFTPGGDHSAHKVTHNFAIKIASKEGGSITITPPPTEPPMTDHPHKVEFKITDRAKYPGPHNIVLDISHDH